MTVLSAIVLVFLLLFANLQKNYAFASAITKTTVNTVAKNTNYRRAFFIDVPKRYKGSMIFRISLPEAIKWIVPQARYDTVIVASQMESPPYIMPYKTSESSWTTFAKAKNWNPLVPIVNGTHDTLNKRDILFWFTADGICKVKIP